ncbi:MAG: tail fiber domain-containing protein [Alphaproteobacteria bacterium]
MRIVSRRSAGFTLIELAIVVGIAGLLFSGLWRLMSSGNSQLREQGAADQISQIASATRSFLASQQGQGLLRAPDASAGAVTIPLAIPLATDAAGTANCATALGDAPRAGIGAYCDFLPAGFSAGTTNPYNQTYIVVARKLDAAAGVAPQNYDFMIATINGDVISDNSGGRLSANIGANGGFIYGAATCPAAAPVATNACGAFNGFAFNPAAAANAGGFGIVNPGAGHIVTLNSRGGESGANSQWLARTQIDPAFNFNTMREDLYMGLHPAGRVANIEMAAPGGTSGRINMRTGVLNLNNGTTAGSLAANAINLENGTIQGPGRITLANPTATQSSLTVDDSGSPNTLNTVELIHSNALGSALFIANVPAGWDCNATPTTCNVFAGQVNGNFSVGGVLVAGTQVAGSFIYSSDLRLKDNLEKIPDALNRVTSLNGYHFTWRKDGRADYGVIAQEVKKVFPELVTGDENKGHLGVEYGNMIAPMIEALKELKAQNEALRQRLEANEAEIKSLKGAKLLAP